jgi:hypothetical protein
VVDSYQDVSEVSFDRELRRLQIVSAGRRLTVDGVDRLYVGTMPWTEADGTIRLSHGRVSVNGNVAAVEH